MKVLILSTTRYPDGGAETTRKHYLAKLFQLLDWQVFVVGRGSSTNFKENNFDGVRYMSFRSTNNGIFTKIFDFLNYTNYTKMVLVDNGPFDAIMILGVPTSTLKYLKEYAKKNKVMLLHDSVEWYSAEQFKLGRMDYRYRKKELWMQNLIDDNFCVIAISKYLEKYFEERFIKVERIPVIMDINDIEYFKVVNSTKLTILYAGSPGKKDYLKEVLEAVDLLDDNELERLELKLIGITREQLSKVCGVSKKVINKLGNSLVTIGRVPRNEVLSHLLLADFTVLLRSSTQRYAKAGFPTKVVESLASATPVICNLTSDLGDYLVDNVNGIIVDECTPYAFASGIRRALNLTIEEKQIMQKNARKTAEDNFDYRLFLKQMNSLLRD